MDHPPQRTAPLSLHSPLVCVGGMLQVANTPQPSPVKQTQTQNVTPFKQLASPFTASAPFTAPTTPTSSITPYPIYTPVTIPSASTPLPQDLLQPQPQLQQLTQKQVRELRRLCRKTANRAQFEGRLIQIRQVASINAMANSTLHLFDPTNPHSGLSLRTWVHYHRSEGADWRDERPLSAEAIAELRRWDLLLKAWARLRFDATPDTRPIMDNRPVDPALKPVRLEFERLSLASHSPVTPATQPLTPANAQKARNVYSTDFLRLASPVTPADAMSHHLATPATVDYNRVRDIQSPLTITPTPNPEEEIQARSAWSKPPLTGLTPRWDARNPLGEVSINRVGDTIKVTVPSNAPKPTDINNVRFVQISEQENTIPADLRRAKTHASTTAKSWRNALMQTPEQAEDPLRGAPKTLFLGPDAAVNDPQPRSPLDWGKFRRTEPGQPQNAWPRNDV